MCGNPFILPENDWYYLYGTTDVNPWEGKATGFDVYRGRDLENWEGPFPAFRPCGDFWADENFWAPEVHVYQNGYCLFASFKTRGKPRRIQILRAAKPLGPFAPYSSAELAPSGWECLDGTLYVDENGVPYMVFCHEWLQVSDGEICAVRLAPDLKAADGEAAVGPAIRATGTLWAFHVRFPLP